MIFYKTKILAYRFFHTSIGKFMLKFLSFGVKVNGLKKTSSTEHSTNQIKKKQKPFLVCMTIDTESGYLKNNDERVWQYSKPEAYIGYYKGIENWRKILNKYGAKATFFLSTNCFSAEGNEKQLILGQLRLLIAEGHEIGLHMHPDSDIAIQKITGKKYSSTSSKFYTEKEINEMLIAGKKLIYDNLKVNPTSFRWGNWAISNQAVSCLDKCGFLTDSSATPGIKGHEGDGMEFDWSLVKSHYPWKLNSKNYQTDTNTKSGKSKVTEIPIATFEFFGMSMRADPAYPVLLNSCFDLYYRHADRSHKPFPFVAISHSTEGTYEDGTPTKVLETAEDFLKRCSKLKDVKFATIREASKLLLRA